MNKNQYKFTGSDESYTYPSMIYPLLDKIEQFRFSNHISTADFTIWLPFDVAENTKYKDFEIMASNFVRILKEAGYKLEMSHIATGQDFLEYEPEEYDLMIGNPPFKNKRAFFERVLELNKPFAMINPATNLNDGMFFDLFRNKQLQLFMPKTRPKFFNDKGCIGNQPSFKAIYYCLDFLQGKDIEWFELDKNKDVDINQGKLL